MTMWNAINKHEEKIKLEVVDSGSTMTSLHFNIKKDVSYLKFIEEKDLSDVLLKSY